MAHRIVIAGVAGSGKSTVGAAVAERLGARFVDGDGLHPPANVAKMAAGEPLTDTDRMPWLKRVAEELARSTSVVIACSALRRSYRDVLRRSGATIVLLTLDEAEARRRVESRGDHFMGPSMVASQFAALEMPTPHELATITLAATDPLETVVERVVAAVGRA